MNDFKFAVWKSTFYLITGREKIIIKIEKHCEDDEQVSVHKAVTLSNNEVL